ncbi:MAG: diversity-generating retroelement protein Avd [Planctomycetes bacterium]|nr:diversity-generating retroelement protein Avd [Planctomycetota bacterium]
MPNERGTRSSHPPGQAAGGSSAVVIEHARDLLLWAVPTVAKFPRSFRFTLGERIERRLYATLEGLVRARYSKGPAKVEHLEAVNLDLEVFRHEIRVAHDLELLSLRQLEHCARLTDVVGRQIGGWARSLK